MPEATDLLVRGGEMTSGFWIRRVAAAPAKPERLVRAENNKENVPPSGLLGPTPRRRRQRVRKSPLPEWHPRTPLRDITAIVNALERRRLRGQAARAAQTDRDREAYPENPAISPLSQESSVADQTPLADSTPNDVTTCITSCSPVENPLPTPSTSSSSQTDHSLIKIEKTVKNNLEKTVKEASSKRVMQRRTLMSMR